MSKLTIGRSGFALPLDAVTTTLGILGIRGSGKTHTAVVIAEEMLTAGLQVLVLDPLDVWYGLRTSIDGKGAGYPITVLGGEHADVPLEAASGAIVAEFAVQHGASLVLSLRHFSKTDQRRFVAEFCEKLYRLKGQSANRSPVHIIIDEADEVAPQKLSHGSERCFGAVDTLVRRGRSSGVGVTLISQRPAAINKDVLTQIELLVAHRVISPQDRKAIGLWIEAHPVGDKADKMAKSLASLNKGECWIWSPSWLQTFERITVRQRRTFDSSATPKVGSRVVAPSGRAAVDLDALKSAMAETIKRAEEDDPKVLKRKIAELERELKKGPAEVDHSQCRANEIALTESNEKMRRALIDAGKRFERIRTAADIDNELPIEVRPTILPTPAKRSESRPITNLQIPKIGKSNQDNGTLTGPQRKIVSALAQSGGQCSRKKLALMAGYSINGGGFNNPLSALRSAGYIDYQGADVLLLVAATSIGVDVDAIPNGHGSIDWWLSSGKLSGPERDIVEALRRHGGSMTKESLAKAVDKAVDGGGFNNPIGRLRTRGLIERGQPIRFADEVMA